MRAQFYKNLEKNLNLLKEAGTYKHERILCSPQASIIKTKNYSSLLNFCSNNYLGLANNQEIMETAKKTILERGFGNTSTRQLTGTSDILIEMERRISKFYEQDDTISFSSCFSANESAFEVLAGKNDAIFTDKLNHASIINGIRLSPAKRYLYENNDIQQLEDQLKNSKEDKKIIVTDGVFSMDGVIGKMDDIVDVAKKYNALIFVDECHGTGVLGKKGRGAIEYYNVVKEVDLVSSTMGKALGGANGGFITGRQYLIDQLRQNAHAYIHSGALSQYSAAACIKAFDIIENRPELLDKLKSNIKFFRKEMSKIGFELLGNPETGICPVLLRDEKKTIMLANELLNEGIYVTGFTYPVVGKGLARIRNQISAQHTEENLIQCVNAYKKLGKKMNLVQQIKSIILSFIFNLNIDILFFLLSIRNIRIIIHFCPYSIFSLYLLFKKFIRISFIKY